jgi:competence protein ComEC
MIRKAVFHISQKINHIMRKNSLALLGIFVGIAVVSMVYAFGFFHPNELRVTFLDVGQGDAILITAPNGRELLIDSGPDQSVLDQLGTTKSFFDRTIDIVMATHSDKDHIGGFPYLFDQFTIPMVIESEISSPTLIDKSVTEKVLTEQSDRLIARLGERIILDPKHGVVIDILFPDQNTTGWETNEASVVTKVSYGNTSFLLTGDSPNEVENHLVKTYGPQLRSNVLKLGHHGSKTSSSQDFLETVHPEIAIVSAGLGNKYGHPNPEVIERVESVNAQIIETSTAGNITCRSDGHMVSCQGQK